MSLTQTAMVYAIQGTVQSAHKTRHGLLMTVSEGSARATLLFKGPSGRQLDVFAEQSIKGSITTKVETEEDSGALVVIAMEGSD